MGAVHHPRAGTSFREPAGAVSSAESRQAANLLKDKLLRRSPSASLRGRGKRGPGRGRLRLGARQGDDQKKREKQSAAQQSRRDLPDPPQHQKKKSRRLGHVRKIACRVLAGMRFDNDWTGGHTKGKPFRGSTPPAMEIAKDRMPRVREPKAKPSGTAL
ncbi:MAG: hypothetical protein PHO89_07775 [Methylacidiphilaceae bacterium]|nr:hypothetical protein [Candidatus Methylacidiphilaceae bacterium]